MNQPKEKANGIRKLIMNKYRECGICKQLRLCEYQNYLKYICQECLLKSNSKKVKGGRIKNE